MSHQPVRLFSLDYRGTAYVIDHLTGVNTFCSALLEAIGRYGGETFTVAPASTPNERLYEFSHGGLLSEDWSQAVSVPERGTLVPIPTLTAERVKRIRSALKEKSGSVCIVDDYNPRRGDPDIASMRSAFFVGDEVYHLLDQSDDDETFSDIIRGADTIWHGVVAVCGRVPVLDAGRCCTTQELEHCAEAMIEVSCSAYDGEGFVSWRLAL